MYPAQVRDYPKVDDYSDKNVKDEDESKDESNADVSEAAWSPVSWDPWGPTSPTTWEPTVSPPTSSTPTPSPPSSSLSTPTTPTPIVSTPSTQSLPPLDNLNLNQVDDETEQVEEIKSASPLPPPPPPPVLTIVDDHSERPPVLQLHRGTDPIRLVVVIPMSIVIEVLGNDFTIDLPTIHDVYRQEWPEATNNEVRQAALVIDDMLSRHRNPSVTMHTLLGPMTTNYRRAIGMVDKERRLWENVENQVVEDRHLRMMARAIPPEELRYYTGNI